MTNDWLMREHIRIAIADHAAMQKKRPTIASGSLGGARPLLVADRFPAPGTIRESAPKVKQSTLAVAFGAISSPDILSKQFVRVDDTIVKESGTQLWRGEAWVQRVEGATIVEALESVGRFMESLGPGEAITPGLPQASVEAGGGRVRIASKRWAARIEATTRTRGAYGWPNAPALALAPLDKDTEGGEELPEVLAGIHPALGKAALLLRPSAAAGVALEGQDAAGGRMHAYLPVRRAASIPMLIKLMSAHALILGLGGSGLRLNKPGDLCRKSCIDPALGDPEHLCYEGAAVLGPGLWQATPRAAQVRNGLIVDAGAMVTALDESGTNHRLRVWEAAERARWRDDPELARMRREHRQAYVDEPGITAAKRQRRARRLAAGDFSGGDVRDDYANYGFALASDSMTLVDGREILLAEVLDDPLAFDGCVGSDPLEDVGYGRTTARVCVDRVGRPFIFSFAHSRSRYAIIDDRVLGPVKRRGE